MTFFILIPLGLLVAILAPLAGGLFIVGAAFLVIYILAQIGQGTGHPGLFWMCVIGGGLAILAAHRQYAEWQARRFVRFAQTLLVLKEDPTGWELWDCSVPPRRIYCGYVPPDKVWFCKQNPQSPEAKRLMEPSPAAWVSAVRAVERDKRINALCASVPRADRDVFMASAEFRAKLHAFEQPYVELERQFLKLEARQ